MQLDTVYVNELTQPAPSKLQKLPWPSDGAYSDSAPCAAATDAALTLLDSTQLEVQFTSIQLVSSVHAVRPGG